MSGVSLDATWYMSSRQVQKVPEPTWTVERRARWKACEWALASPGRVSPRSTVAPGGGASTPVRTPAIRPSATSRATPGSTWVPSQAWSSQNVAVRASRRCRCQLHARPSSTSASAITPATQSSSAACFGRGVRDRRWGSVRTAWRSGRTRTKYPRRVRRRCRGRGRRGRVVAALPQDPAELVAQGVLELDDGREGLPYDVEIDARALGVFAGGLLDAGDDGVEGGLVGGAGVEPAADEGGDGVDAVRLDGDLAEGGEGAGELRLAAGGQHGLGVGEHRVAAVHEPGGARVVGLAPEVEPPAAVRPDGGGDTDRVAGEVEGAALFDVELDERTDAGEPFGVRADGLGVVAGGLHGLRQCDAVAVAELVRLLDGQLPGGEPGPDTGEPEPGALPRHRSW